MQRTTSEEVVVPKVLVLYYSAYGHIERMAQAVAEGARETGTSVDIKPVLFGIRLNHTPMLPQRVLAALK